MPTFYAELQDCRTGISCLPRIYKVTTTVITNKYRTSKINF